MVPPLHRPMDPDASLDFHAARLLLLIDHCGSNPGPYIDGRTKLAKLDFFVRYPSFLRRAQEELREADPSIRPFEVWNVQEVEAPMIRYRYGPWDHRYRQFLAFLESRNLVTVTRTHRPERVKLTSAGRRAAETIGERSEFAVLVDRCTAMRGNLAEMSGTALKDLIYEVFPREVGELEMQEEIVP
ncbi:hypothetical protein [Lentzea jiangxiensis]|uniref:hypothetical protein n=1 Tax=Lentzea jiangxiensis TaxID=641025 RepID=UPI00115FDDB8|nr:hypothetical protein [Lentzea jiangxiensis]